MKEIEPMKQRIPLTFAFLFFIFISWSCASFTPPANWPTINKSESDFRKYLDENVDKLNPLEGIWSIMVSKTKQHINSGTITTYPPVYIYRIAIVRDSTKPNYEFTAVLLDTQVPYWEPGRVKAVFRSTAYEKVYDGCWYSEDYSEDCGSFLIDESGLIKFTTYIGDFTNYYTKNTYKTTIQLLFIKAYPPLTGKSLPSQVNKLKSSASGFLLTSTGLVVTNYHVVEDADRIEIVFPEKNITKTATIRIKDTKNDIAILEIKDFSFSDISTQPIPFSLANVNSVKVGQEVFTLGFPLGEIMGTKPRLSTGRINSLFGIQDDPRLFQISTPLQPGNSGGPLFNTKGEIVGIVISSLNAKYFYENTGIIPQNVNFAVKANYLQSLISMTPDGDEVAKRKNSVKTGPMENQIEQLNPFIVQIRVY